MGPKPLRVLLILQTEKLGTAPSQLTSEYTIKSLCRNIGSKLARLDM
jgi:hypothetical protein